MMHPNCKIESSIVVFFHVNLVWHFMQIFICFAPCFGLGFAIVIGLGLALSDSRS